MPSTASDLEGEFQLLIGRDPYEVTNGKLTDRVQGEVLRYFNSAAQFHMESGLRNRFISAAVPDVSPKLRPIITGKDAEDFYRGLSVPYVAMTLQRSTDPAVKRLNVARAERRISDEMRTSKVYRAQAQELYALAWQEQFPGTETLKNDQRQNSRTYREKAEEALTTFIDQQCEGGDDNVKALVRGILRKYLTEAQSGRYWAFRALLAYLTNKNLASLDPTSDAHGDIGDPANPSRKLMRQCAVLNALDETGKFATFLQDMVRHRVFSVALPQKIDFKGNEKELSVICRELLEAFMKQTEGLGPQYDKLRLGVEVLLAREEGERNLDRTFSMFFGAMASSGTSRSLDGWLRTHINTAELRNLGTIRKYSPKIGISAANMVRLSAQTLALGSIAMMMCNGVSWGQMTAKERAATVVAGVDLFLITAPKVLSLSVVTLPDAWNSVATWMKSRSTASATLTRSMSMAEIQTVERAVVRTRSLSAAALLRSETAGLQAESGLRKWLTGKMTGTVASTGRQALAAGQAGEVSFARRFFGRNLDHFMATRVGLLLAISGLGLGIWGIATARDDKERWINIALTAAAAMEVCSIAIGMAGTAGLVGRVGSFLGPIGMIASVAVVGYMIYDAFGKDPPPSIIEQFVRNEAQKAGLYMPYEMDIDHLASTGSLGLGVGVTVVAGGQEHLRLDLENDACATRKNGAGTDYDADTVFDLYVDGKGNVTITSSGYSADADPYTGTPERKRKPTVLMVDGDKKVIAGALSAAEEDEDAAAWESAMLKGGIKEKDIPKSGEFSLRNRKTQLYLALANGAVTLSGTPFGWKVTTGVPMRKRFSYGTRRFDATTSEIPVDEDQAGAKPINWEGQNLPKFITLADDGSLKIDDGELEKADKRKTWYFTVTARNAGGTFSSQVDLRYQDDFDDDAA